MAEFLPLCDVLFNVVSLAGYFCDVVFDLVMVYTLYVSGLKIQFGLCLGFITFSTLLSNVLSVRWYLQRTAASRWKKTSVVALHVCQLGVLWRYAGLFVPVQLTRVKRDVRDLCVLRLIHAFVEAAPMLLLQLQLLPPGAAIRPPADLTTVSSVLSLFSICWALASFSKNVRLRKVDGLVLTWLGVISQFLWRGGTVSARFVALGAYTVLYGPWILLVLCLHWVCMLLWLLSLRGERALRVSALLAAVYVVAYVNLQERPHRRRMAVFYVVMALENGLLLAAWLLSRPEHWLVLPLLAACSYASGLGFMLLYYRCFHVRRLHWDKPSVPPGVFNCRFAGPACAARETTRRKKKKPTSFVPPPTLQNNMGPMAVPFWRRPLPSSSENEGSSVGSRVNIHQKLQEKKQKQLAELKIIEEEIKQGKLGGPAGGDAADDPTRQPIPRVKKHIEPSLCWPSRPDLATNNTNGNLHKLTNYKQSLGELAGLNSLGALNNLASYLHTRLNTPLSPILGSDSGSVPRQRPRPPLVPPPRTKQRSRTPEILLSPHFLYCDWTAPPNEPPLPGASDTENADDGQRVPSDIDSQVSLPRSYTLPREFKYYRRARAKRRPEHFVASTNSSDGDVDSADNESDSSPHLCPAANALVKRRPYHSQVKHETKL